MSQQETNKEFLQLLSDTLNEMESGVYNFCQNGKCIGCGECCSALLPVSEKEIRIIKKYVKKTI